MSRKMTDHSRYYVQAIFAVAAAIALSTSACGKKDQGSAPAPVAPAAPTAPAKPVNTADVGKVGTPSELNGDSGKTASDDASGNVGEELTAKLRGEGAVAKNVESVIFYDPSGLTSDQIRAKKLAVENAGVLISETVASDIVSADGQQMVYTGSGKDTLRAELNVLVNERARKLDAKTRAADKKLAQSLQLSDFDVSWTDRSATLKFYADRKDHTGRMTMHRFTIQGALDANGIFKVGNVNKGPYFVGAEVACMDIDGDCRTIHVRVQDRSTGRTATAHMIARHTNAVMSIDGSSAMATSKNPEYRRLMQIFVNTMNSPGSYNSVFKLYLTTSETIGGASNFGVKMDIPLRNSAGTGGDYIELAGPLVATTNGAAFNVGVNVPRELTVIENQVVSNRAYNIPSRFVESIRDARLVQNDGMGTIDLEMTIRNSTLEDKPEKVFLNIQRIHTPLGPVRIPMQ